MRSRSSRARVRTKWIGKRSSLVPLIISTFSRGFSADTCCGAGQEAMHAKPAKASGRRSYAAKPAGPPAEIAINHGRPQLRRQPPLGIRQHVVEKADAVRRPGDAARRHEN